MKSLESLITTCIELGATQAMVNLGVTSGEISQRQAEKVYGSWFKMASSSKRIYPVRTGNGVSATKWYKVTDILALRAQDELKADLLNLKTIAQ